MKGKKYLAATGLTIALIIAIQNTDVVTLRFLFWDWRISQVVLIPLIFLFGGLVGAALARIRRNK